MKTSLANAFAVAYLLQQVAATPGEQVKRQEKSFIHLALPPPGQGKRKGEDRTLTVSRYGKQHGDATKTKSLKLNCFNQLKISLDWN